MATSVSPAISSATSFSVHWTAPGDDSLVGRASHYDLRYSKLPITAANYYLAAPILGLSSPATAGAQESFVVSGLSDDVSWFLAIKSADESGNWSAISNLLVRAGQTTGETFPTSFSSPWPNPARVSVQWAYSTSHAAQVQVDVFDVSGRHVSSVAHDDHEAGRGNVTWDLSDDRGTPVGAGIYIVKARIGSMAWTKRLTVLR
jgi:hypothetical protein